MAAAALCESAAYDGKQQAFEEEAVADRVPKGSLVGEYQPTPLDTSAVVLTQSILDLTEQLARNTHDVWARKRLADGWRYGPRRDDARKEHPDLVPYEQLSDSDKEYDRHTALETLKAII